MSGVVCFGNPYQALLEEMRWAVADARDQGLEMAARIVEKRGKEIGGAVQPDRTASAIREAKATGGAR